MLGRPCRTSWPFCFRPDLTRSSSSSFQVSFFVSALVLLQNSPAGLIVVFHLTSKKVLCDYNREQRVTAISWGTPASRHPWASLKAGWDAHVDLPFDLPGCGLPKKAVNHTKTNPFTWHMSFKIFLWTTPLTASLCWKVFYSFQFKINPYISSYIQPANFKSNFPLMSVNCRWNSWRTSWLKTYAHTCTCAQTHTWVVGILAILTKQSLLLVHLVIIWCFCGFQLLLFFQLIYL